MVKVIGAGHGRTGTASTRAALKTIYGGPCYHMDNIIKEGGDADVQIWMAMYEAKGKGDTATCVELAKKVLAGQECCIDYPASYFYKELMVAFPDAKVLLTVRDTPEAWYKSTMETLWAVRVAQSGTWMQAMVPKVYKFNEMVDALLWEGPRSIFKGKVRVRHRLRRRCCVSTAALSVERPSNRVRLCRSPTRRRAPSCTRCGTTRSRRTCRPSGCSPST